MGTIAQLKARLTLETDEYMAQADKVIRRTSSLGDQMQKIGAKVAKSYVGAITHEIGRAHV